MPVVQLHPALKRSPPMAFPLYATVTDQDLSAIVTYLRTVRPKE